jgi:hypothetical protein
MVKSNVDAVTEQLRSYATRGVFREFNVTALPRGRTEFRFTYLTPRPVHAIYDSKTSVLKLPDLLPAVAARSRIDRALREFLIERRSSKLVEHRRLSKKLVPTLRCSNAGGNLTLALTLNRRHHGDATRQVVHLVSEIFQNFLAGPYHQYMVEHFGASED